MQISKSILQNVLMFALGFLLCAWISSNIRQSPGLAFSFHESQVQKSIDLLTDLSTGGQNAAKRRIEFDLKFSLKQINFIAKVKGNEGERAKVVQKVVSKWRSDNSNMALDPELAKEIQIASAQTQ